jgi:hypothetical protein
LASNAKHFLPRAAFAALAVLAAALPHSIAAAEIAAGVALLLWLVALASGQCRFQPSPLDLAIDVLILASLLAAFFSLEPRVSLPKLASTALILVVPVVAGLVRTGKRAETVVAALLVSGAVSAAPAVWDKVVGRGVEIGAFSLESPLVYAGVEFRDVILACDGQRIRNPKHFARILAEHDPSRPLTCEAMRTGALPYRFTVPPERIPAPGSLDAWGVEVRVSRGLRARGRYSHFVTYAEVMLQLAALALGLWLAFPRKRTLAGLGLAALALLLIAALAATFTRASWAALTLAALAMLWIRAGRKWRLALLVAAPLAVLALNSLLVEWRGVGFYNPADLSMQYRRAMWADGLRLIGEHPLLGIGQDTVLVRWQELGVRAYADFKLHSHFHSTPIQLAVERGLLGLGAWLVLMALIVRLLWRLVVRTKEAGEWQRHGLALGSFGAVVGFLASGLLHYNFGDSEVVMVFWLLTGVAVACDHFGSPAA